MLKPHYGLLFLCCFSSCLLQAQKIDSLQQVIATSADKEAIASAYRSLLVSFKYKDSTAFRKTYRESIEWASKNNELDAKFKFLYQKAVFLTIKQKYDSVIHIVDSIIPELQSLNFIEHETSFLNYSANAYSSKGDYPNALVKQIENLEAAKKIESSLRPRAMASNNVGMVLLNMERYDQAIPYLEDAVLWQKNVERHFRAHTYWNLGICYMEKRQYDKALEIFDKGVAAAKEKNDKYALSGNLLCIASVYIRQDDLDNGIIAYKDAYELTKESNMEPFKHIEALNGIIFSYNHSKNPQEALKYIKIADSITEANDLPDVRNLDFLLEKSRTLYQLGEPIEAQEVLSQYVSTKDSLYSKKNIELIQEKETEYRTKEKEQQLKLSESELASQRLLTTLFAIGAFFLALIGILVYRQQRLKIQQQKQEQALKEALLTVETNKKLEAQRLQIAKELHDNIGSQLTYLASAAQNIGTMIDQVPVAKSQEKLGQLATFSQDAMADLRDTLWVMNRPSISVEDLVERIRYLAYKVSNTTGIKVLVENQGNDNTILNPTQAMDVYRIIQESVANAVKHAEASEISIDVAYQAEMLSVAIADNGKGYDKETVTSSSNGLSSLENRAHKLEADLIMDSEIGKGTKVHLSFNPSKAMLE